MLFAPTRFAPKRTREFQRIVKIPQRDALKYGESVAGELTKYLKKENGTMELLPLQAAALLEAYEHRGLFVALPVGYGKTLISVLLGEIFEAKKPLLLVPGSLLDKTRHDIHELQKHWRFPLPYTKSYEYLSTHPDFLKNVLAPDLIVADEAHRLQNKQAACTKRIWQYWCDKEPIFVPLSGTIVNRSFFEYWHLMLMALPEELCFLPMDYKETELWSAALDEKAPFRASLGALEHFGPSLSKARNGFGKFMRAVPGVIGAEGNEIGCSLRIHVVHKKFPIIDEALTKLQNGWELPDGTELTEATEFWRHSRTIANGFYYRWAEEPPREWLRARKAFHALIHQAVKYSKKWTAPAEAVANMQDNKIVKEWLEIKNTFEPKTEVVWLTDEVIMWALGESSAIPPALIWYEHRAVGQAICSHGHPTFGSKGRHLREGQSITEVTNPTGLTAVSVRAISLGQNLQRWSRNLVLNCEPTGRRWEQLIGRTHRRGQEADEVEVTVLVTSDVQLKDFRQARADAEYIQRTTGQRQKLCYADIIDVYEEG